MWVEPGLINRDKKNSADYQLVKPNRSDMSNVSAWSHFSTSTKMFRRRLVSWLSDKVSLKSSLFSLEFNLVWFYLFRLILFIYSSTYLLSLLLITFFAAERSWRPYQVQLNLSAVFNTKYFQTESCIRLSELVVTKYFFIIHSSKIDQISLRCGVPQGSTFAPLLFKRYQL